MPRAEVLIFRAHEKLDAQGRLTDQGTARFLGAYLVTFAEWVRRFAAL